MKRKRDRSESNRTRSKINRWVRFLSKEEDWDYCFMIEMERMKLQQMEEYFKERNSFIGIEYVQRDLRICLRLLNIIQGKDNLNIKLSPFKFIPFINKKGVKMYSLESKFEIISYKKLYVNTRNANRFVKFDFTNPQIDKTQMIMNKDCLRKEKAWYLYNLIRTYRMFGWWD